MLFGWSQTKEHHYEIDVLNESPWYTSPQSLEMWCLDVYLYRSSLESDTNESIPARILLVSIRCIYTRCLIVLVYVLLAKAYIVKWQLDRFAFLHLSLEVYRQSGWCWHHVFWEKNQCRAVKGKVFPGPIPKVYLGVMSIYPFVRPHL